MDFSVKHGFTYMAILACVICILSFLVPSAEKANTESEETVATSWNVIKTNVGGSTYSSDMDDGEVGSNIHINVKVTFDPNTGKLPSDWENYKIVTTNEPYGVLPTPTKVGYIFTGWYTRAGYPINENEIVKLGQDHTLTARWTQAQYTVEYYDGDKLLGHQKAYYEDTFNLFKFEDVKAEKTGYHFYKWRDANDVAYDAGQSVKQLCQNDGDVLKLYIDWQPNEYTVHFDGNQGTVSPTSKKVLFDDYYGSMPTATRQYYTFYGWYTAPDSTGTRINEKDKYTIPGDSTLYAHWERNLYKITYIIEGKSYEYSAYQGEPVEQPDTTKTGYTFLGWFDKETGGTQITDFGYKTQTVYAQYKANSYLVTFDPNGGTVETGEKTVTYDSIYGTLPLPVKVGYVFKGWYLPDGTQIKESSTVKILKDTTLTAKWTASQYTVAYYSDSKKIAESTHLYDTESKLKTISEMNLAKKGYIFQGWSRIASSGTVEFTDGASVANLSAVNGSTVNLYAVWKPITYKIEYYNGNTLYGNSTHTYDKKSKLTSVEALKMNKPGYTFKGWTTSVSGSDVVYQDAQEIINLSATNGAVIKLYAVWNTNTYTVTYYDRGNKVGTSSFSYDKNGTLTSYIDLNMEKTGYHFKGWAVNETDKNVTYLDKATVKNLTSVPNGNVNLYAIWEANVYTINYFNNGIKVGSSKFTYDVASNLLKISELNISKEGYTFEGWGKSEESPDVNFKDGETIKNLTTKNNDVINLYTKWSANTYTVSFDPAGGNCNTVSKEVVYDSIYGLLPVASRVGYQFNGWYYNDKQINADTTVKVASDHTLTAKWTANTYTIEYYDNSGSSKKGSTAMTYDVSKNLSTIADLNYTKTGYTFQGWGTNPGTTSVTYKDGVSVKNLTASQHGVVKLYAVWKANTYTIKYNGNGATGGSTASSTHTYDVAKKLTLNGFIKTGYNFKNWNTDINGNGTSYSDGESIINLSSQQGAIINLYAQWTPHSYTVGYYSDGNKVGSSSHIYDEEKNLTTISTLNLKKTGYIFQGWDTSSTAKNVVYTDGQAVINLNSTNSEFKLYAVWKPITYSVTYNGNGATSGSTAISTHTYDVSKALTTNGFVKTGYNFKGWSTSMASTTVKYGDKASVINLANTQDAVVNLYAVWQAKELTVTFNPNGGSVSPTSKKVIYDSTYGALPIPTRTGYLFNGWYLGNNKITSSTTVKITSDSTLNAMWTPISYTIVYNGNGATSGSTASSTHTYDVSKKLTKNNFTKTGYAFQGWATSSDGDVIYRDEDEVVNLTSTNEKTINLYAVWKINAYTISFDANGGTTPTASKIITYNDAYGLLPIPTRTGYTFDGWFTDKSAGNEITSSTIMNKASDHTLYAHWTPNTYILEMYHNNSKVSSMTLTYDKSSVIPSASDLKITKTGYSFSGWTKNQSTGVIDLTDGATVKNLATSGTVKVYSVWSANTYTVTFNPNGGTVNPTSKTVTYDSTYGTLPTPSYTGYSFAGWYNGTTLIASGTTVKTANNHTLTAKWSVNQNTTYTVKHYLMNVNGVGYTLNKTETLSGPTNSSVTFTGLSKDFTGFTYKEAKVDGSSTPSTESGTTIKGDGSRLIELYYSRNQYNITVSKGTGINSVSGSGTYYFGANISVSSVISTGYTFSQWTSSNTALLPNSSNSTYAFSVPAGNIELTATAKANTYTIKYNGNGATGGSTASSIHTYNVAKALTTNGFTRTGYTFLGWATSSTATSPTYADKASVKNLSSTAGATINLYAVWQINDYSLIVNPNGGTYNGSSSTQTFTDSYNKLKLVGIPLKTGYTFTNWTLSGSGNLSRYGTSLNNDTFFKAGNNGVSVYNNSGNGVVTHTRQASQSDNPTGSGYEIKIVHSGGTSTPGLGGFVQSTYSKADGIFYHVFTAKIPVGYSLNIAMNSTGTGRTYSWVTSNKGTGEYETYIYKLTCGSTGTFSTFGHVYLTGTGPVTWYLAGSTVLDATNGTNMPASAQVYTYGAAAGTLSANWTANTYTVKYDGNGATGGSTASSTHTYGTSKALTANGFTKTGYAFLGWSTNKSATSATYTNQQQVTNLTSVANGTVTLYAVWQANSYNIIYNGNGATGGSTATSTHTYGVAKTLTANGFTRTGYTFKNWNTKADGTGTSYTNQQSVTNLSTGSAVTLYAQWTPITYTNTISHWATGFKNSEGNNGAKTMYKLASTSFTAAYNSSYLMNSSKQTTIPNGFTLNSQFGTSSITGTFANYNMGTSVTQKSSAMSYEYYYSPTTYSITYNMDGGTNNSANPSTYNVLYGVTLKEPTRAGYKFAGWYNGSTKVTGINPGADATFTSSSDLYSKLASRTTGNITLTAHWEQAIFTVTYNGNGGTSPSSVQKQAGSQLGTLPTSTRTGYIFAGWYTAASGGTKISSTTVMPNNNVTYYAHWTPITYTIKYNGNGATGGSTASSSHTYGVAKSLTSNGFTKTGYTFLGWATSASGSVVYTNGQSVSNLTTTNGGTVNLYAVWTVTSYRQIVQVRYENADGTYTAYENVIDKNYNYGATVSWSRAKDNCYEEKSISYTVTGTKTTQLTIQRNRYTLTIAGLYNGNNTTNLGPVGKNDVYINGTLSVSATNNYSVAQRYGATYEIKNIQANSGYKYMGVSSGNLTGTITANTTVRLNFNSLYKINFYSNKTLLGSLTNIAYTQSKTLTTGAALNATLSGYTFVGWDTVYLGDVNKDGNINSSDSILISQHISGSSTLTSEQQVIGDYNRNEELDNEDVAAISATDTGNKPYIGARITYDDGQSISKLSSTPNGVVNLYATYTDIQVLAEGKENSLSFPVGYVMQTTTSTNPGTVYGGTWTQIAKGRTLVGVDENDQDFDTPEKTGGSKEVVLTVDQLPAHTHSGSTSSNGEHSHSFNSNTSASYGVGTRSSSSAAGIPYYPQSHSQSHVKKGNVSIGASDNHSHSFTTNATGGNAAHNNMQPYYVVYTWKKVSDLSGATEYYTVNFIDGLTGEVLKTEQVKASESATPPTPLTHTDYEFIGWSDSYTEIYKNMTIKAQYKSYKEYATKLNGLTWISNENGSIDIGVAYDSNDPNLKFIWKFYDINADKWYLVTPSYSKSNWASWYPKAGSYWIHVEALGSDGQTYTQTTGYNVTDNTHLRTGWVKFSDGTWHHYQSNGAVTINWLSDGGYWYYLDPSASGAMKTGWGYIDDNWYYFDTSGHMKTGWIQTGNYWYYMQSTGEMVTGWKQIGGYWYYFEVDASKTLGHMYANCTVNIGGTSYTFDSNGHML